MKKLILKMLQNKFEKCDLSWWVYGNYIEYLETTSTFRCFLALLVNTKRKIRKYFDGE